MASAKSMTLNCLSSEDEDWLLMCRASQEQQKALQLQPIPGEPSTNEHNPGSASEQPYELLCLHEHDSCPHAPAGKGAPAQSSPADGASIHQISHWSEATAAAADGMRRWWGTFGVFWNQPTREAAIALALLYLTVLSLGLLMTAYIKALGLTEAELAVDRGFGAMTGIIATFSFPLMRSRLGEFTSPL